MVQKIPNEKSLGCTYPDVIRGIDLGVGNLRQNIHALQTRVFLRNGEEYEVVLIVESPLKPFQVRFKADQIGSAKRITFTTSFIGDLGKSG
jgi:hypothetical protein